VTLIGQTSSPVGYASLRVEWDGHWYPAEEVGNGAAYELLADHAAAGFVRNPRPGARYAYRRFVHTTEIGLVVEEAPAPAPSAWGAGWGPGWGSVAEPAPVPARAPVELDDPVRAPVTRSLNWSTIQRMSQTPPRGEAPASAQIAAIRRSATIRRGTHMLKVLSARQLAGHLRGWLPAGFCYRQYDVAHLRTPDDLAVLRGDGDPHSPDVIFALRWRAVDPADYMVPFAGSYPGLVAMPAHDRAGPPVIGNGFAPTDRHLIPEFVTTDLADLPVPANTALVAYTADGTEVTLYSYLPEQRAWTRMFGPQWRHLVAGVPASSAGPFPAEQEYFPVPPAPSRYVGRHRGEVFDAFVDPPDDFRILAKTRGARYPIDALARRVVYAGWRDANCTVVRAEGDWLRVRLCRPDGASVARLGAHCVERGVYEAWAPAAEVVDAREVDLPYEVPV
jgi:hypothetical protein